MLVVALSLLVLPAAGQATITVDTTADNTTASDGACTLREAITNANSNSDTTSGDCAAGSGTDRIEFAISGAGPHTISPGSALPDLTDPVFIDGETQTGAACGSDIPSRVLEVALDGSSGSGSGLTLATGSDGSTIRGLVINNWAENGIEIGGSNNVVECDFIGTDVTGSVSQGNNRGVFFSAGATNNTIGGITAGVGNLISGNDIDGVTISFVGTTGNLVQGNFIGTDVTGTSAMGNSSFGIVISGGASGNTIGGTVVAARNVISGNNTCGVCLVSSGTTDNVVLGNYIGTNVTGMAPLGNAFFGVLILGDASNNTIGGTASGAGNVISDSGNHGVQIEDSGTTGNVVQGNYIGTDATGTASLGNHIDGVSILDGASNNTIGGTTSAARNIISGNDDNGIRLVGSSVTSNLVQGNFIGTDVNGTADLGNGKAGIFLDTGPSNNTIGGTTPGAGNLISGNDGEGIRLFGLGTTNNVVAGNFIGTDVTGTTPLGNSTDGVFIEFEASGNTIGGTSPGAGNVISANRNGILFFDPGSDNNLVQGNFIGTDVTGTVAVGNNGSGIFISNGASSNMIGGMTAGAGNVISGNTVNGVLLIDSETTGNVVQGNFIGTDATGAADLGNSFHGVRISGDATNNIIGGTAADAANTVAFNGQDGIVLLSTAGTGNAIQRNRIFNNTQLGIDLGDDGITANDPSDSDTGPNKLQNFPTLTAAFIDGVNLLVSYSVDTDPAHAAYPLAIEFFEADADDEEGKVFLGSDSYTTGHHPGARQVNLGSAASLGVSSGDRLVATATDNDGNTSEFSTPFITVTVAVTRYVATTGNDSGNDCTDSLNPCATIGHAVSQANAGDTIDIAAGTYAEPGLVIDKALNFQGQGVVVQ